MPKPNRSKEYWKTRAESCVAKADRVALPFRKERRKLYKETYKAICDKIDNLYFDYVVSGQLSTTRLYEFGRWRNMQTDIQQKISHIGEWQNTEANQILSKVYKDTLGSTVSEFGKQIQWGNAYDTQMQHVLSHRIQGKTFSDRIWSNTDKLASRIEKSVKEAAALGQGADNIKKEIMRDFGTSFNDADRLVRTETMYMYNQATLDGYKDSKLVEMYEFLAEIDCSTSPDCEELNGERFLLDDAITGENFPPMHPNCRSTIIPVTNW